MRIRNPFRRPPAPPNFGNGKLIPEETANWLSIVTLQWLSPLLSVGYSRPLQQEDLWDLRASRHTENLTEQVETRFFLRCEPSKRPKHLQEKLARLEESQPVKTAGQPGPDREKGVSTEGQEPILSPYDESLFKALHRVFFQEIWTSGFLCLVADTLRTTTPLLNKVFFAWLVESYVFAQVGEQGSNALGLARPNGIGYGIGLAFALFSMQEVASVFVNHGLKVSMTAGQSLRAGLVGSIVRKSLRLSGKARAEHTVGQIITMISTDGTNLEQFLGFAHTIWVSPIQLVLGFGLLIGTLGYSALVGLGVIVISFPIQLVLVKIFFTQRNKCIKITDKRVQLTTEVLQGIRMIKFYGWEAYYIQQIGHFRGREVKTLRKGALAISALICVFHFTPILAAILAFITYSLTGHDLSIPVIFASLQLFNIIRIPLLLLPIAMSSLASAVIALGRISKFLSADELQDAYLLQEEATLAVDVDADFSWETVRKPEAKQRKDGEDGASKVKEKGDKEAKKHKEKNGKAKGSKGRSSPSAETLPSTSKDIPDDTKDTEEVVEEPPYALNNVRLSVPKGALIGVVGRIGSGKSSVLQAIIGEMRRTRGEVIVSGKIAYVPQTPWIQNATLRDNIIFGQDDDENRFREVVAACSLEHDLDTLPFGEQTEIGEKGINLSGGQKARVSLARAAYSASDIILLDDPLSAVDSYVGKSIMDNCILSGPLAARTRILVTHSLHVLHKMDYIYFLDSGSITEQGTFDELMAQKGSFTRLIDEYGRIELNPSNRSALADVTKQASVKSDDEGGLDKAAKDVLMQLEERNTGAVTWETYKTYLFYAGGLVWITILVSLLLVSQGISVGTNLWLGFWTANELPQLSTRQYMAIYAGFGSAEAVFVFFLGFAFFAMGLAASLKLFTASLSGILHSPLSFFDTTPMGRIVSRLTKDIETLDNELAQILYSFLSIFVSLFGIMALVFYTFPYLGIIFAPLTILYYFIARYYRFSSVETKRLDSIMRSSLYAAVSEMLTGLATIRAYGLQHRSTSSADRGLDMQNRAYYLTITIQRWLALRLDFFGNLLILGIALFAAGFRETVNPAKVGVVLTYTLGITVVFSDMVSQFAINEQNMNAVERVVHYAGLPPEGDRELPDDPSPSWPEHGALEFKNVHLAYREGLPLVLRGVSFSVNPREKIGIVGRTGAGKSSLLHALFRTVALTEGSVEIDGMNVEKVGLQTLRTRLALVPQDSVLFLGTLRENLDPQGLRTDAELIAVLQRAWLLPQTGTSDAVAEAKFSLDSIIGDEGSNYSAGEKQLLSLSRALARNSHIIVLDEATSNVDAETDAKLQRTIQREFASATVLCIAHRLNTIAYYDRILVMDAGQVAEFDTVLNLFDREDSIFRSLCDEANLSRADILRIKREQKEALGQPPNQSLTLDLKHISTS